MEVERGLLRSAVYATDFNRYAFVGPGNERVVFPYAVGQHGYSVIEEVVMRSQYPKAYSYLAANKRALQRRKQFREWYGFSAPRNLYVHDHANLLVPLLAERGTCAPFPPRPERFCVMASAGFSISIDIASAGLEPTFVLGLANSKLLFWYLRLISNKFRGGWITCTKQYFGTLPIRRVDRGNRKLRSIKDAISRRVERIIALEQRHAKAGTGHEREVLRRQITAADLGIDRLVYELYGLSEEEIRIVEETTAQGEGSKAGEARGV